MAEGRSQPYGTLRRMTKVTGINYGDDLTVQEWDDIQLERKALYRLNARKEMSDQYKRTGDISDWESKVHPVHFMDVHSPLNAMAKSRYFPDGKRIAALENGIPSDQTPDDDPPMAASTPEKRQDERGPSYVYSSSQTGVPNRNLTPKLDDFVDVDEDDTMSLMSYSYIQF